MSASKHPLRAIAVRCAAGALSALALSISAAHAGPSQTTLALAADRSEIAELSAHFDNALDAEDAAKFVAVFTPDGALQGFWGESKGPAGVRQAFDFMLATFAHHKRHGDQPRDHRPWRPRDHVLLPDRLRPRQPGGDRDRHLH